MEENPLDVFTTQDAKHGRIEDRHGLISLNTSEIEDLAFECAGLKSIGYTLSFRKQTEKEASCSSKYYINSSELTSEQFLNVTRDP
ncbi:MAG: hypothetical protein KAH18_08350 [Psychromonas sp.]|nr:hypothetical protein [Psychromonas sp.]